MKTIVQYPEDRRKIRSLLEQFFKEKFKQRGYDLVMQTDTGPVTMSIRYDNGSLDYVMTIELKGVDIRTDKSILGRLTTDIGPKLIYNEGLNRSVITVHYRTVSKSNWEQDRLAREGSYTSATKS